MAKAVVNPEFTPIVCGSGTYRNTRIGPQRFADQLGCPATHRCRNGILLFRFFLSREGNYRKYLKISQKLIKWHDSLLWTPSLHARLHPEPFIFTIELNKCLTQVIKIRLGWAFHDLCRVIAGIFGIDNSGKINTLSAFGQGNPVMLGPTMLGDAHSPVYSFRRCRVLVG